MYHFFVIDQQFQNQLLIQFFQILFGNTFGREARFGLDALKAFSTHAIMGQHKELKEVRGLLIHNGTSQDYVKEFDEIAGISSS